MRCNGPCLAHSLIGFNRVFVVIQLDCAFTPMVGDSVGIGACTGFFQLLCFVRGTLPVS